MNQENAPIGLKIVVYCKFSGYTIRYVLLITFSTVCAQSSKIMPKNM